MILSNNTIDIDELEKLLNTATIAIDEASKQRIKDSRAVVEKIVTEGTKTYGINTGFGKFSETKISRKEINELQRRIVLSHACGVGNPLPDPIVRLMMILKLKSYCYGFSGCSIPVVIVLREMLNNGVYPVIPEKGSVGASGDLAPLSHMALAMIGEGDCRVDGKVISSKEALKRFNIEPVELAAKDGLAILNGTQTMGAYLSNAMIEIKYLMESSAIISAMTLEGLTGTSKAFDERIQQVRGQKGQFTIAKRIRELIEGSELVNSRDQVQDAYSVRCIPQVHGAILDTFEHVKSIIEREINGVTDNPLVFSEDEEILSGGNFHGEPLALAADFMSIAIAELANIAERRISHMIDSTVSHLPAFLVEEGGLNSGYMIPQYTAAALVSENKVLAHPASVDSVPTSANKEDHVSMGTHACRKLNEIVENVKHVLSIELLCAAQAIDLHRDKKPSPIIQEKLKIVRELVPFWDKDRLMKTDMDLAYQIIHERKLL